MHIDTVMNKLLLKVILCLSVNNESKLVNIKTYGITLRPSHDMREVSKFGICLPTIIVPMIFFKRCFETQEMQNNCGICESTYSGKD